MSVKFAPRFLHVLLAVAAVFLATFGWRSTAQAAVAPLVTPAWLRTHLHEKTLIILDVYLLDRQRAEYEKGHIPGAIFAGFFSDGWHKERNGVPGLLPPQDTINAIFGKYGITPNSRVVLVPGGKGLSQPNTFDATTWLYWALNAEGVHNVSILNGGDDAWRASKTNPIATGSVYPHSVRFIGHLQPGYLADAAHVHRAMTAHKPLLVDARPPAQYEGKEKSSSVLKAGTIPGAVDLPAERFLTKNGQGMVPEAAVKRLIAKAGITPEAAAITFCNISYLASMDWFALHAVAGHKHVLMYAGSMADWTRHKGFPVVPGKP